jgi:hypothetical protein
VRKSLKFAGPSSRRVRGNTTQPYAHTRTEKFPQAKLALQCGNLWAFPQSDHSEGANVLHDSRRRSTGEVRELRTVHSQREF